MIPEQILDVLAGDDVLLIPPAQEGVMPMPAEAYADEHAEALLDLGLAITKEDRPEGEAYLLYNPEVYPPEEVESFAKEGRLSEYVNGAGNNQKPADSNAVVSVTTKKGEPVRDIMVASPQQAEAAIARNQSSKRNIALSPLTPDSVQGTLRNRIQRIGEIPNPVPVPR